MANTADEVFAQAREIIEKNAFPGLAAAAVTAPKKVGRLARRKQLKTANTYADKTAGRIPLAFPGL